MPQDHYTLGKTVPPRDKTFKEICRYIMQAADPDYPALGFIASLYSYADYHGGLTPKQRKALDPHARLFLGQTTYSKADLQQQEDAQ